jgi:hypothetical protein
MSQQAVSQFLELVASDGSVEATLNAAAEQQTDVAAAAVALGKKHGLEFSGDEFTAAVRAFQHDESGELDEAALETVAGGFNPQPEPPAIPIGKSLLSQKWSKSLTTY